MKEHEGQMTTLKLVKAERQTQTNTDTIVVTKKTLSEWKIPPFQRDCRVNAKVLALAEELKFNGGVFPGILTIGILKGTRFIVDGQHRCKAFEISELEEAYTDVRFRMYESMADMAEDFVRLNSVLVRMRPDDILRGLEGTSEALQMIRKACPFVGYDQLRRSSASPVVSMSALMRCWFGGGRDVPASVGVAAPEIAKVATVDDAERVIEFLNIVMKAWGRDPEYAKLWGALNMTMCMWVYRKVVLAPWSPNVQKFTKEQFAKGMGALAASGDYIEWLHGRVMSERDRSPAYRRLKSIIVKRLESESSGRKVRFPQPAWVSN